MTAWSCKDNAADGQDYHPDQTGAENSRADGCSCSCGWGYGHGAGGIHSRGRAGSRAADPYCSAACRRRASSGGADSDGGHSFYTGGWLARILAQSRRCWLWNAAEVAIARRLASGRARISRAPSIADQRADEPRLQRPICGAGAAARACWRAAANRRSDCAGCAVAGLHRYHLRARKCSAAVSAGHQRHIIRCTALCSLARGNTGAAGPACYF